ncbi:response regulator [bacterium]|nr:response regulator [bacterium]
MKKPLILIVDDNPHISKLITINLEKEGYEVTHAANGEEGLQKLEAAKPDLVISDVMMPKIDGITMCQQIRTQSSLPMIPFMFLTSIDADVTLKRGFRTGADQYLIKSEINRDVLLAKINDMLKHVNKLAQIDASGNTIQGDLSELSLVEIIQLLHIHKKTGTLTIRRQFYPEATIVADQGEIIHATLGEDLNEKVLQTIAVWKRGEFVFTQSDTDAFPRSIKTSTINLILESCRTAT